MTQYLENMKTGDTILFQGPSGRLFYHGSGTGGFTLGLQLGGRSLWLFHCSRNFLRFESHGLVLEVFIHSFTHPLYEIISFMKVRELFGVSSSLYLQPLVEISENTEAYK